MGARGASVGRRGGDQDIPAPGMISQCGHVPSARCQLSAITKTARLQDGHDLLPQLRVCTLHKHKDHGFSSRCLWRPGGPGWDWRPNRARTTRRATAAVSQGEGQWFLGLGAGGYVVSQEAHGAQTESNQQQYEAVQFQLPSWAKKLKRGRPGRKKKKGEGRQLCVYRCFEIGFP